MKKCPSPLSPQTQTCVRQCDANHQAGHTLQGACFWLTGEGILRDEGGGRATPPPSPPLPLPTQPQQGCCPQQGAPRQCAHQQNHLPTNNKCVTTTKFEQKQNLQCQGGIQCSKCRSLAFERTQVDVANWTMGIQDCVVASDHFVWGRHLQAPG